MTLFQVTFIRSEFKSSQPLNLTFKIVRNQSKSITSSVLPKSSGAWGKSGKWSFFIYVSNLVVSTANTAIRVITIEARNNQIKNRLSTLAAIIHCSCSSSVLSCSLTFSAKILTARDSATGSLFSLSTATRKKKCGKCRNQLVK